jgi:hypothetical protein
LASYPRQIGKAADVEHETPSMYGSSPSNDCGVFTLSIELRQPLFEHQEVPWIQSHACHPQASAAHLVQAE